MTQEQLKEYLEYDSETGIFKWIKPSSTKTRIGDIAGTPNGKGYINIRLLGSPYRAHRLAWLYVYGEFPEGLLDHIDCNRSNNRIDNLREATSQQNSLNSSLGVRNKSGIKGVHWHSKSGKWRGVIRIGDVSIQVGLWDDLEQAADEMYKARQEQHGEYARH